jgi:uncharacterized membrane protein
MALSRRNEWLLVAGLLVLAAALRISAVGSGAIWLDEGYSLLESERGFFDILALGRYDASPPLYVLVLHLWRTLFGPGELAAKSLSVVAGVAGVAAVWLAARARFGALAALVAGLLVALSRFHLHYSQEIRGYTLLFCAVAAADFFFVRWDAAGRKKDLFAWLACGLSAMTTHYFAWWMLGVDTLLARRRRVALVAMGGLVLACTPMLATFVLHLTTYKTQAWILQPDFAALVHLLWVLGGCGPIAVLVWGLAILGLTTQLLPRLPALLSRDEFLPGWRTAAVPGLQLTLPFLIWIASLVAMPMLVERYLLLCLVPLACLAGAGVAALRLPAARYLLITALLVFSIPPIEQHYLARTPVTQELADLLRAEYRQGDVVLYTSKWNFVPIVALHPPGMEEYLLPEIKGDEYSTILLYYTSRRVRRDPPERGEYKRLWLVRRPEDVPEEIASTAWFQRLRPRLAWEHPNGQVLRFDLGG